MRQRATTLADAHAWWQPCSVGATAHEASDMCSELSQIRVYVECRAPASTGRPALTAGWSRKASSRCLRDLQSWSCLTCMQRQRWAWDLEGVGARHASPKYLGDTGAAESLMPRGSRPPVRPHHNCHPRYALQYQYECSAAAAGRPARAPWRWAGAASLAANDCQRPPCP